MDRRAGRLTGQRRARRRQRAQGSGEGIDRRQQVAPGTDAIEREKLVIVAALPGVAEGEGGIGDVGGAGAGQALQDGVLAVAGGRRRAQGLRLLPLQMRQQRRRGAREEHVPRAAKGALGNAGGHPIRHDRRRPRVGPEDRRPHLAPLLVEQPEPVTLRRDADQLGRLAVASLAHDRADGGNDLLQILFIPPRRGDDRACGTGGDAQDLAVGGEGDRLDDRRAGVDADQHR